MEGPRARAPRESEKHQNILNVDCCDCDLDFYPSVRRTYQLLCLIMQNIGRVVLICLPFKISISLMSSYILTVTAF